MPEEGQTLRLTAGLEEALLNDDHPQPVVRLEVIDTGIGIAPEIQAHLFEPFFTGKKQGTGLGLFTSYNIIESHHGQITVASQVGQGTTFTILLPVVQP